MEIPCKIAKVGTLLCIISEEAEAQSHSIFGFAPDLSCGARWSPEPNFRESKKVLSPKPSNLLASFAVVDISPTVPTVLGCNSGELIQPNENPQLEANLVFLRDSNSGDQVLIVSIDALYPGPSLTEFVVEDLAPLLTREEIFFAASHTHSAPSLDSTKPLLGLPIQSHFEHVSREISDAARTLIIAGRGVSVELRLTTSKTRASVSRRRIVPFTFRNRRVSFLRAEMLPSRRSHPQPEWELLEFYSKNRVIGALWVMPCHPVAHPNGNQLSADYIGDIRTKYRIEASNGGSTIGFVFLQGASGDLRPLALSDWNENSYLGKLLNILVGPRFSRFSGAAYLEWLETLWEEITSARKTKSTWLPPLKGRPEIVVMRREKNLSDFFRADSKRRVSIHKVRVRNLSLLGISAEPTWAFRNRIMARSDSFFPDRQTIVGCIDDTFGYLASPIQQLFGGYEVSGFMRYFDVSARRGKSVRSLYRWVASNLVPSREESSLRQ